MKRVQKSPEEPELLTRYRQRYPRDTWDKFHHRSRDGYRQDFKISTDCVPIVRSISS